MGVSKQNRAPRPRAIVESREVVVTDLTDNSIFPELESVKFDTQEHKYQTRKLLLELVANPVLTAEYFFYNLYDIFREDIPVNFIGTFRRLLNSVLHANGKTGVLTDENFMEVYSLRKV